jgi:hypothetical protein
MSPATCSTCTAAGIAHSDLACCTCRRTLYYCQGHHTARSNTETIAVAVTRGEARLIIAALRTHDAGVLADAAAGRITETERSERMIAVACVIDSITLAMR